MIQSRDFDQFFKMKGPILFCFALLYKMIAYFASTRYPVPYKKLKNFLTAFYCALREDYLLVENYSRSSKELISPGDIVNCRVSPQLFEVESLDSVNDRNLVFCSLLHSF